MRERMTDMDAGTEPQHAASRSLRRSSAVAAAMRLLACAAVLMAAGQATAQISFSSAIDLALKNSQKVKIAEADVARAQAGLQQAHDVYVPSVVATSSGLGDSTGFPLGLPTVFSISAQSLVFSFSQRDYIRAAVAGLEASQLALKEAREEVSEDAAITYLSLDRGEQKRAAYNDEAQYAAKLVTIVKERLDAGQDNAMEYTRARRTEVQLRLQLLQQEDTIASESDHLARLIGIGTTTVHTIASSIPPMLKDPSGPGTLTEEQTPGVQAAFATARSKREQAFGDARYTYRPQIGFGAEYSRFSTYNNNYATYYPGIQNQPNAFGLALDITVPLLNLGHKAEARASLAEADKLQHEAVYDQNQALEARLKLSHSVAEIRARAELASLDRDLAAEQLQVVLVELQNARSDANATPASPKEEQNARIEERQRTIDMIDAELDLEEAEIRLLRQTGRLDSWLHSADSLEASPVTMGPPKP